MPTGNLPASPDDLLGGFVWPFAAAGGAVLAASAGAVRTGTAYGRLRATASASDVGNQPICHRYVFPLASPEATVLPSGLNATA
jgi:hypothetical protein